MVSLPISFFSSSTSASSLTSPITLLTISGVTILGSLSIAAWHFLRDNLDEKRNRLGNNEYKEWVVKVCGGDKFVNSLLKIGFIKSSFKWFIRDSTQLVKSIISSRSFLVKEGSVWINAPVYTLNGEQRSLYDYRPKDINRPLILNFGSWS